MTQVVEDFILPDGTPDTGKVTFRLSARSYQPGSRIHRTENDVTARLINGSITVHLEPTAGDDADWAVPGVHYKVIEHLTGRPERKYRVDVPSDGPARLGELEHL